jgi:hypothetical protein
MRFQLRIKSPLGHLSKQCKIRDTFFIASRFSSSQFYKVTSDAFVNRSIDDDISGGIIGKVIDNAVDLKNVRPGETIEIPYEITINESFVSLWQSAFYSHDRINTSTPFTRSLGLQGAVIPFTFMLFLASSMSHADYAKLENGHCNARYLSPAYAGDTFKKKFVILNLRPTSDGLHSIFRIHCELKNQRGITVFTCEKTMLFPFQVVRPSEVEVIKKPSAPSGFLNHLLEKVDILQTLGSQSLTLLRPGQLIIHKLTRPLTETQSMQLASLARLTHERHFNTRLFKKEEMLIPGGLVLGLTCSIASRDLHEVLFEELKECSYPNKTNPDDTVGAVTYVTKLEEHVSGDIEALHIRTIGIKNMDVQRALANMELPLQLFTGGEIPRPAALEDLLKKTCPDLCHQVVCIADRIIYRQAPQHAPFLL